MLRQVVVALRGTGQLSQKECAGLLGITPKAVDTRLYRARALLGALPGYAN